MRRKDREIKDLDDIGQILEQCTVCHLGMCCDGMPYVVPMNYGFSLGKQGLTLYFHCAGEGKKLEILRENPQVCFTIDRPLGLMPAEIACRFSMAFESVIGSGTVRFLNGTEEKVEALRAIMRHYSGREWDTFDPDAVKSVALFAVDAEEFTAKRRPLPQDAAL